MHAILCLLLAAVAAAAPTPAPFNAVRARAIDALARAEVRSGSTPGLAIGVVQDGLLVYARGFGAADVTTRKRTTRSSAFYVGEISEQFTAACVLLLAQQKRLSLDDRVTRFVPELSIARGVTIAQLLNHTSGLPDISHAAISHDRLRPLNLEDAINAIDRLQAQPAGQNFARNPFDDMIAALIVQRVSGVPLSDYMQAHIFLPLIMNSTFLAGDQGAGLNLARGYTRDNGRFVRPPLPDPTWLFGSSGVITTVGDLAKWDIGMPLLLDVDSLRAMWTANGIAGAPSYAMGWMTDRRGGERLFWQSGELPGYHSMNELLPDQHIAVIVLANAGGVRGRSTVSPERIANRILAIVAPLPPVTFSSSITQRAASWIGRLQRLDIDRTELTPAFSKYLSDQVVIRAGLKSEGPLESIVPVESYDRSGDTVYVFDIRFRGGWMRYEFALAADGKVDGLLLQP